MSEPDTKSIHILLLDSGTESEVALTHALKGMMADCIITRMTDADSALEALVAGGHDICFVRSQESSPEKVIAVCTDAHEAGIRTPIIVLSDISSNELEERYIKAGAMAAVPWDGSQLSMVRNMARMAFTMRKTEESLRRSNNHMVQDMVTLQDARERAEEQNAQFLELAEELSLARDELEKLNQEKNKFFSIIAHDLRSPFTSLLGYTNLIEQMHDELTSEEIREYASHINDSATRVFKLLENLLEWARLQMDHVQPEPIGFPVHDIAERTIEVLAPVANDKHITILDQTGDTTAFADTNQTDAIIRNLVNNAIKFTNEGGTITISAINGGDITTVSVTDTGVGMSDDVAKKLFQLSENVTTDGTSGEKGTGLGLLLCKELAERNGGKISVKSQAGVGSTFSFTLPTNGSDAGEAGE